MKATWLQMGMPITINISDSYATESDIAVIANYFRSIDERFSPYKATSELSKINSGRLSYSKYSSEMREILQRAECTKKETNGYFDISFNGKIDTCGIVKGWAIYQASRLLIKRGLRNFYIDAGGDIEIVGNNATYSKWMIGIKNPFNADQIIKVVSLTNCGIATSGSYNRGQHIYNPKNSHNGRQDIVSLTVIGPNVYEADRFATAAFAMGRKGILFIEQMLGFEGYQVDKQGIATYTSNFEKYIYEPSKTY